MTTYPDENTPHNDPLNQDQGFTPADPQLDEGHGTFPADEGLVGRHVDPDAQPDGYRDGSAPADAGFVGSAPVEEHHGGLDEGQHDGTHDESHGEHHVEGKSLGEHEKGESFKEWLAADVQQTKEDFHIGKKHD